MLGNGKIAILPSGANYSLWPSSNMAAMGHRICAEDLVNKWVDCSSKRLTEVPQDLYPDVHRLDLNLNNLTTLRNVSFQSYLQLEDIMIGSANIRYIESCTFQPLKNLKYLELWNNPGLLLVMDVVQWSSELKVLNLSACRLNFFDFRVLNFLPKLEELDLTFNEITTISGQSQNIELIIDLIPSIVTEHAQVRFLDGKFAASIILEENPIQMVDPDTIAALPGKMLALEGHPLSREAIRNISIGISKGGIDSLTMKSSGIRNITYDMFEPLRNTYLAFVGFVGNRLTLYPFVFANLRLLFELDLTECGLTVLEPEYFYGMSALRKISLFLNNFHSVNPYHATWSINVHKLSLSLSYVGDIDEHTFKGLHNLSNLELHYENKSWSDTVEINLRKLENLTIMRYHIETVILKTPLLRFFHSEPFDDSGSTSVYDFRHSKLIEHLKISNGALSWIYFNEQFELMRNLNYLTILDLGWNYIDEIPSNMFKNFSSLQTLLLHNNNLRTISSNAFAGLINLIILNLKDNKIRSLPDKFLEGMNVLRSLRLSSNELAYLDENLFSNTTTLSSLALADNRFVGFNQTTFIPIYFSLKSIDISGNILVCNCENTKWIVEKLGESLINQDQTICSTTSDTLEPLRGKPIRLFQPSEYCGLNVMLVFLHRSN